MRIDVHVFMHDVPDDLLVTLNHKVDTLMASNAELLATLTTLNDLVVNQIAPEVTKVGAETVGLQKAVADLTAALGNTQTTPEVDAALAALQTSLGSLSAQVKTVDALVPDVPATP